MKHTSRMRCAAAGAWIPGSHANGSTPANRAPAVARTASAWPGSLTNTRANGASSSARGRGASVSHSTLPGCGATSRAPGGRLTNSAASRDSPFTRAISSRRQAFLETR